MLPCISRAPRGACGSLDPNAYAGCRAYCEACVNLADGYVIVDILNYNGVSCRTVSGWKHSSTKASLTGVITLKERYHSPENLFIFVDR